jgi:hypothetical protein
MIRPCASDRMNSCMAWRLRHTVMVQNSVGPATRLAQRTRPSVRASWRRMAQVASSIAGKKRTLRSLERVVTASNCPPRHSIWRSDIATPPGVLTGHLRWP